MKYIFINHFLFFSIFYTSINCSTQKLLPKILYGTVFTTAQDTKEKPLSSATVTIYSRNDSIISTQTDSLGNFSINMTDYFKKLNNPFYIFVRHSNNFKNTTKIYKNFKNPIKIIISKSNASIISK